MVVMAQVPTTRIDRWLWSVRLCSTRSDATAACRSGHVRINGQAAKPASAVVVGDRIEAKVGGRLRVVEVVDVIDKRVGAPVAASCYLDRSPPPPARQAPVAVRERGTGRPTKRERRQLDRFRS